MLDTCCVTNERLKVTCFVTNADNLTMLCREEDVEANVCLHLHAKLKTCLIIFDVVAQYLPSALSKVATHSLLCCERLLSTRVSNVARIWHVPVSRRCSGWWVSLSAQVLTCGIGRYFLLRNFSFLCDCRVDSKLCDNFSSGVDLNIVKSNPCSLVSQTVCF